MLNKTKIALMGAIAAAGMVSNAANAATVSATAEVDILSPVQLQQMAGLDFGVVAPGAAAGTVTLGTGNDTQACSVGLACIGAAQRGRFEVLAANGYNVIVTVAASTTLTGAGAPMTLNLNPGTALVVGAGATAQTFYVGGVLTIGAGQAAGTYTGIYNVSADYQ